MDTKKITVIPVDDATFSEYQDADLRKVIAHTNESFNDSFATLYQEFQAKFKAKKWIYLTAGQNEAVYYINDIVGLMPDLDNRSCDYQTGSAAYNVSFLNNLKFAGFNGDLPTKEEVKKCFNKDLRYFRPSKGITVNGSECWGLTCKNGDSYEAMVVLDGDRNIYKFRQYDSKGWSGDYWTIPIFRFNGKNSPLATAAAAIIYWLEYDLTPKDFPSDNSLKIFTLLKNFKTYFKFQDEQITLDEQKVFEAVKAGTTFDFLKINSLKEKTINDKEYETSLRKELLNCDNKRVGLDKYDKKLLLDPNRGHWDLWNLPEGIERGIKLSEAIYARDPKADVNIAGIVGIDFGTKSTVVVYENERGEIIPLQVGAGDYSKGIKAENYENPTIIEFRHIDNFLAAYNSRPGRPKTSCEDVTVSHNAKENLKGTVDSSLYASFFENLKQWCGNLQYTTKIRDHDGTEKDLPPFNDIAKDEFNPLEYYAYYLGSYINHMLRPNHIFLKYILSFPVMYERKIREHMLETFRAGILKSLPSALLANGDMMKIFQLVEGTSEPAAYATTALDGYGFLNGESTDGIYYAVFDFGGGTTDFDFGVLKLAEGDDADFYDYVLIHFGSHGDRTLGGENLLRLMAFQVFKANSDKLLKPRPDKPEVKIPFTWAADKMEFAGSEGLIRQSQEANLNMHNLMEALRPIWEAPDSKEATNILNSGKVSLTLFDDTGKEITGFDLLIGAQTIPNDNTDEVKPLPNVQTKSKSKTTSFDVSDKEFVKVIAEAKSFNLSALSKLKEWAKQGHKESLATLETLSKDSSRAKKMLDKLKAELKASEPVQNDEPEPVPKVEPKSPAQVVDLKGILRDRISRGIDSFFLSMRDAFDKVSGNRNNVIAALRDVTEIKIFLAGNSTKSALVKELFEEYTNLETGKAYELLGFDKGQSMPRFVLYPPLGTEIADKIQQANGITVDKNDFARPTGKTGVAFGLLRCREGSTIRVVDITPEAPFQFYIGRARMGKFTTVIDKTAKRGEWYKFIGAKRGVEDLLYTDDSRALTNNAPASIAKRLTIRFEADPEASVYIKPIESNKICCAVTKGEPTDKDEGTFITLA